MNTTSADTTQGRHRAEGLPPIPRHRAENPADPSNTSILNPIHAHALKRHAAHAAIKPYRAAALTTGTLVIAATGMAGNATAGQLTPKADGESFNRHVVVTDTDLMGMVQADPGAIVAHSKVEVKTQAAPPPPPPPAQTYAPVARPRVAAVAPNPVVPKPKMKIPVPPPVPVPPIEQPPVNRAGKAPIIAAAALAQLGRTQDCTKLATNSLAAAGIRFHGWPAGYLTLGGRVAPSQAIPGDLIYYANGGMGMAHIAVYIGGGMAVHGGWNGNQTVKFSANVGSGPVFIRV